MFAIPTRGELFKRVCHDADVPRAIEKLPDMLHHMRMVYDRTNQLYTLEELHALP